MNKTNAEILSDIAPYDLPGSKNATYLQSSVLSAMDKAREDEREKISQFIEEFMAEYKLPQLTSILDLIK